jgi:hypothetical protein
LRAAAACKKASDVSGELASRSAITGKVHASYAAFRAATAPWSRVSIEAVLRAREGESACTMRRR